MKPLILDSKTLHALSIKRVRDKLLKVRTLRKTKNYSTDEALALQRQAIQEYIKHTYYYYKEDFIV